MTAEQPAHLVQGAAVAGPCRRGVFNEAAEFATNDAEPDAAELWTDVYAG